MDNIIICDCCQLGQLSVLFSHVVKSYIPLPNDKILDWSKFKAFADNKIDVTGKSVCSGKGTKHCGKRSWLPVFSSFLQCFQKTSCFKAVQGWDCVVIKSTR